MREPVFAVASRSAELRLAWEQALSLVGMGSASPVLVRVRKVWGQE